jgi:hypothetical protein
VGGPGPATARPRHCLPGSRGRREALCAPPLARRGMVQQPGSGGNLGAGGSKPRARSQLLLTSGCHRHPPLLHAEQQQQELLERLQQAKQQLGLSDTAGGSSQQAPGSSAGWSGAAAGPGAQQAWRREPPGSLDPGDAGPEQSCCSACRAICTAP